MEKYQLERNQLSYIFLPDEHKEALKITPMTEILVYDFKQKKFVKKFNGILVDNGIYRIHRISHFKQS